MWKQVDSCVCISGCFVVWMKVLCVCGWVGAHVLVKAHFHWSQAYEKCAWWRQKHPLGRPLFLISVKVHISSNVRSHLAHKSNLVWAQFVCVLVLRQAYAHIVYVGIIPRICCYCLCFSIRIHVFIQNRVEFVCAAVFLHVHEYIYVCNVSTITTIQAAVLQLQGCTADLQLPRGAVPQISVLISQLKTNFENCSMWVYPIEQSGVFPCPSHQRSNLSSST